VGSGRVNLASIFSILSFAGNIIQFIFRKKELKKNRNVQKREIKKN